MYQANYNLFSKESYEVYFVRFRLSLPFTQLVYSLDFHL